MARLNDYRWVRLSGEWVIVRWYPNEFGEGVGGGYVTGNEMLFAVREFEAIGIFVNIPTEYLESK